jgi:hypothetical protein
MGGNAAQSKNADSPAAKLFQKIAIRCSGGG